MIFISNTIYIFFILYLYFVNNIKKLKLHPTYFLTKEHHALVPIRSAPAATIFTISSGVLTPPAAFTFAFP